MAMENGPFEDVFPIENGGYSIAMLVYQRVTLFPSGGICLDAFDRNTFEENPAFKHLEKAPKCERYARRHSICMVLWYICFHVA